MNPLYFQISKFGLLSGSIAYDLVMIELSLDCILLLISMINYAIIL